MELSGATVTILMNNIEWNQLKDYTFTPEQAEKLLGKDITPISQLPSIP